MSFFRSPQAEKDAMPHPYRLRVFFPRPLSAPVFAAGLMTLLSAHSEAGLIHWGSKGFVENSDSKGRLWTPDFRMNAGVFTGNFVPTFENRTDWAANWIDLGAASFDSEEKRFAGIIDTATHAGIPAGSRVYFWVKNGSDLTRGPEWILLTSASWAWPGATSSSTPALVWTTGETSVAPIIGLASAGECHLTSQALRPVPIPKVDWLASRLPAGFTATEDSDGDGLSDTLEYFLGSHPGDSSSAISPSIDTSGNEARLSLKRNPYAESAYILEASDDLKTWFRVSDSPVTDRPDLIETQITVDPEKPSRFFRFQLQPRPTE